MVTELQWLTETGSRGEGLALIYKDTLDCKLLERGHADTFEHAH